MALIREITEGPFSHIFFCPGCRCGHGFNTDPKRGKNIWTFNNNFEKPTVRASILVKHTKPLPDKIYEAWTKDHTVKLPEPEKIICHSFITDGQIQFLGDCTHDLKGKTVPLEDF